MKNDINTSKIIKSEELWNKIISINETSNVQKLKYFELLDSIREDEIKNITIKRLVTHPWEIKVEEKYDQLVDPSKIVGTYHSDYYEKTLFESINLLKRFDSLLHWKIINPNYYNTNNDRLNSEKKLNLLYILDKDEYYINGNANHRLLLSKALKMDKILIDQIDVFKTDHTLKDAYRQASTNGFEIIKDSGYQIRSEQVFIKVKDKYDLIRFFKEYDEIKNRKYSYLFYNLCLLTNKDYRNKYSNSDNELKHEIHYNKNNLFEHIKNYRVETTRWVK